MWTGWDEKIWGRVGNDFYWIGKKRKKHTKYSGAEGFSWALRFLRPVFQDHRGWAGRRDWKGGILGPPTSLSPQPKKLCGFLIYMLGFWVPSSWRKNIERYCPSISTKNACGIAQPLTPHAQNEHKSFPSLPTEIERSHSPSWWMHSR